MTTHYTVRYRLRLYDVSTAPLTPWFWVRPEASANVQDRATRFDTADAARAFVRSLDLPKFHTMEVHPVNDLTVGERVTMVVNFSTRRGTIEKVQKNGRIVVRADEVFNDRGRRLYAAQRFTLDPAEVTR